MIIITGSYHITLYTRIKNTPIPFRTKMLGCEKYPAHVIGYELKTYSSFIPSTSYPPVITTSYHPFSTSYPPATGIFLWFFVILLDSLVLYSLTQLVNPYPLVMTNSSPWYRWPLEIDGLPINSSSMVIFDGELLKITRWYYFFNCEQNKQRLNPSLCFSGSIEGHQKIKSNPTYTRQQTTFFCT